MASGDTNLQDLLLPRSWQTEYLIRSIAYCGNPALQVEIGAFRTYPQGYKPPDEPPSEYQSIPLNKIEDFGVHCKQVGGRAVQLYKTFHAA